MSYIDITGKKFGMLVATLEVSNGPFGKWIFTCECGNEKLISKQNVMQGKIKSCGCLRKKTTTIHNLLRVNDFRYKRYGRLTVVSLDSVDVGGKIRWNCTCDCGARVSVMVGNLLNGHTRSCGCSKEFSRDKGEVGLSKLMYRYKCAARRRGILFDIGLNEFKKLTSDNCFYCGEKPLYVMMSKSNQSKYTYNGIDRVDSNGPYSLSNTVTCCAICNRMKLDHSQIFFYDHLAKIYNNLKSQLGLFDKGCSSTQESSS